MSLIAYTQNFGFPFIIGDLLISSNEDQSDFIPPTATSNVNRLLEEYDSYVPDSLHQKIHIIKDNLCVALAGNVAEMKQFLAELKIRIAYYDKIKCENIVQFLNDHSNSEHITALIMVIEKTDEETGMAWRFIKGQWSNAESYHFEGAFAAGSGAIDYLEEITRESSIIGEMDDVAIEVGEPHYALTVNLCLIAQLLAQERYSLRTLNKRWGAGFETVFFDGTAFKKIDNISYIVWYAQVNRNSDLDLGITLILHSKYYGEVLTITSIQATGQKLYKIFPLDWNENINTDSTPSTISFKSTRIVNCCVLRKSKNTYTTFNVLLDNMSMKVSQIDGELSIDGIEEIEEILSAKVQEKLKT